VSGRRVILLMLAGVLLVAAVTLALYFLTRQDTAGAQIPTPGPSAAAALLRHE